MREVVNSTMKIKSILIAFLFVLMANGCGQRETANERIQTGVENESKESTEGKVPDEEEPYLPS